MDSFVISVVSLLFVIASAIIGIAVRGIVRVARLDETLKALVASKEKEHNEILRQILNLSIQAKDDREATNRRLEKHDERIWELHDAVRNPKERANLRGRQ